MFGRKLYITSAILSEEIGENVLALNQFVQMSLWFLWRPKKESAFSSLFIDSRTPQWLSINVFPVCIFYRSFIQVSTQGGGFGKGVEGRGKKPNC